MSSTRLPGKVLIPLGDRSVLAWVIRAARLATQVDEVVVATSSEPEDDAIALECERWGCLVIRGSLEDVASRFVLAARESAADAVVRLTADCPLLDPVLIDQVVALWRSDPEVDYVSTTLTRTLPRGLDVELMTRRALGRVDAEASGVDRTHVTSMLYRSDGVARMGIVVAPPRADLRVTLDVAEDLEMLKALTALLTESPTHWRSLIALLDENPGLIELNARVLQKRWEEG